MGVQCCAVSKPKRKSVLLLPVSIEEVALPLVYVSEKLS